MMLQAQLISSIYDTSRALRLKFLKFQISLLGSLRKMSYNKMGLSLDKLAIFSNMRILSMILQKINYKLGKTLLNPRYLSAISNGPCVKFYASRPSAQYLV